MTKKVINFPISNLTQVDIMSSELGIPSLEYVADGILIHIYRAKRLHEPTWFSATLKNHVLCARESYMRYGFVPREDEYDAKSAIYLARVVYIDQPKDIHPVEEWISMRFVPADGFPRYSEDLTFCLCGKQELSNWLLKSHHNKNKDITKHIVTMSRICGIPPRPLSHSMQLNANTCSFIPEKFKHTGISFAFMNKQFFNDCTSDARDYQYITGLFHDGLIERALTVTTARGKKVPAFTLAHDILGIQEASQIKLNRSLSFAYEFPAYFLKADELYALFLKLLSRKIISISTFAHYLHTSDHPENWMDSLDTFKRILPEMGKLLTTNGKLHESKITGITLRSMIDASVDDGPKLRLMKSGPWCKSIDEYISLSKLRV